MNIIRHVSEAQVFQEWLKSELYHRRDDISPRQKELIKNPDLTSESDNSERKQLLCTAFDRSALVNSLPRFIRWHEGVIQSDDIDKLFMLPVIYWYLDSGGTFKLTDIPAHIAIKRGFKIARKSRRFTHLTRIEAMKRSRTKSWKHLIIITSNSRGPYTIIDGTHRAVALLERGELVGQQVYLGIGRRVVESIKSIERLDLADYQARLAEAVRAGDLW